MMMKSMMMATVAVAALAGFADERTKTDSFKVHFVERATGPVTIDGSFDDAAWKTAEPILDWGPVTFLGRTPAKMTETWIRYLWDDKYLYIAARCGEEDFPEENLAILRKKDMDRSQVVYNRDCIELHVDGNNDRHTKFQCWFSPTEEKQIFWYYDFGWGILEDRDYGLNADWDYKVRIDDKGWQVEGRLALAHFEMKGVPGNICAIEPCRFRLMKHTRALDGGDLGVTTTLWGWATQGGDHSDTPRYGKLVFVEKKPKDLVEGLRLAYPDLDKRKILVQTTSDYIVVDKGRISRQAYADRARSTLAETQKLLDRTDALVKEPAPPGAYSWTTNGIAKERAAYLAAKKRLEKGCDIGLLTEILDNAKKWNVAIDDGYWNTLRALLRKEGTPRHPVRLAYDASLPTLADEEAVCPDPASHRYPCVEWAKNLAEKPPKTLIVVDKCGEIDAYLLKDRLGLDADIYAQVPEAPNDEEDYWREGLYTTRFRQRILENMLAKTKYDAMVFLGVTPQYWTPRLQLWIDERLREGLRVVQVNGYSYDWDPKLRLKPDRELLRGGLRSYQDFRTFVNDYAGRRLYQCEPVEKSLPSAETGTVGKGTVTLYRPGYGVGYLLQETLSPCRWTYPARAFEDEYAIAATVRTILSGLGLRPVRRAIEVTAGFDGTVDALRPFDATLTTDGPEAWKGVVSYVVRDTWGKIVQAEKKLPVSLEAGERHVSLAVKGLETGRHTVDAWLLSPEGGVMDFVSTAVAVADRGGAPCGCNAACRRVLPPAAVTDVALAKRCFEANETIVAKVTVSNAVKGMAVEATVRDPRRRAVIRERFDVAVTNGVATVAIDPARLDHACNFLETKLLLGKRVLAAGPTREFFRHDPRHADYEIFADTAGFGGQQGDRRDAFMQHFGVTLFQTELPMPAFRGGNPVYRHWISGDRCDRGGSMSSPHYARDLAATFAREARALRGVNGHFLSLGDDSGDPKSFPQNCSPDWLPPFLNLWEERFLRERERQPDLNIQVQMRNWFKARGLAGMGGIGNFHWGFEVPLQNGFRSVLKARLSKADIDDLVNCFRQAYPTVERFNRHNRMAVKDYGEITTNTIAKLDPVASPEFLNFQFWLRDRYGKDVKRLNAAWKSDWKDFFDVKDAFVDEQKVVKNFAPAVDRATYFEDNFIGQFRAIASAVKGVDPSMGVGLCASTLGNAMPEVLEHLNTVGPYLGGEEIEVARCLPHVYLGETIGVYGGRLVPCPMREYQVYHGLFSGANFSWFWATAYALHGDMSALPERSRRQLETYREVTRGPAALTNRAKRQNDGIRILISRTAGRLEPLVPGQGTHAQSRASFARVVEDLGFQFDYITTHQVERGELVSSHAKVLLLGGVQTFTDAELSQIRAFVRAGGKVLADTTPGIADNWGRLLGKPVLEGQYELLGFKPAVYTFLRGRGELGTMRTDTLKRFAAWGLVPKFRTVDGKDEEVTNVEYSRFVRGDVTYLGYEKLANSSEKFPMKAFLKLEKPQWVHEVRSGRAYGLTDTVELELKGLDCFLFACLPAEAKPVRVEAAKKVVRGGTLHVKAQSSAQTLRFEMVPPDGYSEERFEPFVFRLLDTKDGVAECDFAIAWDEPYDRYTLVVTDVATGKSFSQKVEVRD